MRGCVGAGLDEFDGGSLVDITVGVNHDSVYAARRWLSGVMNLRILRTRGIRLRPRHGTLSRILIRSVVRILIRTRQNPIIRRDRRSLLRPPLDCNAEERQAKESTARRPQTDICSLAARAASPVFQPFWIFDQNRPHF
jgi:hypothetical protein